MDVAVSMVRAYLHANGYFTVSEYPVVESLSEGRFRVATDLDILAIRLPGAGRLVPGRRNDGSADTLLSSPDNVLQSSDDRIEMLIGEVKEGRAELNRGAHDPGVLRSALRRFGGFEDSCCDSLIDQLLEHAVAEVEGGPRVRLLAFGSWDDPEIRGPYRVITLGHIVRFFERVGEAYWDRLSSAQFKDPFVAFMMLLEKARRFESKGDPPPDLPAPPRAS